MELRHLRYFVAVAEELHFRRAAERLHVAQPAVSEQIRKLEEELGVRLFNRTQRCVSLTDAGSALLREARRVLEQAESARLAARNAAGRSSSILRIGYVAASLPAGVPRTLQCLVSAMPHLKIDLEPGFGLELVDQVRASRLDAAIVSLPTPAHGLRITDLGEQRAVAVFAVGNDHAVKRSVRLEQLAPERIIVLPRAADRPFYDAVIAACREARVSPTLIEVPDGQVERALLAVASGTGMAVLPESVRERYAAASIRFVPLDGTGPSLASAVISRHDREHLPTIAFLRSIARARARRATLAAASAVAV